MVLKEWGGNSSTIWFILNSLDLHGEFLICDLMYVLIVKY